MIEVLADAESLAAAAADRIAQAARRRIAEAGRFTLVLSGGSTPRRAYEALAREDVPWRSIHVFWGDERWVPHDDAASNVRMAREALLDRVPVPAAHVHPIPFRETPALSAVSYEQVLRTECGDEPRPDLVLLGMGADGHTASLFPGTPALESRRWVEAVKGGPPVPDRITLTAEFLNRAATCLFLVAGADKAETLREVLEGPCEPRRLPAQLIAPVNGRTWWLVDRAAAGRLSGMIT